MIKNAQEMLHKEQSILWKLKDLFTTFRGDSEWVPVGTMRSGYDDLLLAASAQRAAVYGSEGEQQQNQQQNQDGTAGALTWNAEQSETADTRSQTAEGPRFNGNGVQADDIDMTDATGENGVANGVANGTSHQALTGGDRQSANDQADEQGGTKRNNNEDEEDDREPTPQPQRMTTRALASAPQPATRSPTPPLRSQQIHPFFLASRPDPSHPTPSNPEDDPLTSLLSYISKQEEIVRLADELYTGLLRALRMRKEVFAWCKAEGHVGEMSDGEDWVDHEEWGLEPGELVKGREEDDNGDGPEVIGPGRRGRRGGRGGGGAGAGTERG
jgi:hypothetical protein